MFNELYMDSEDEGIQNQAKKKKEEHVEKKSAVVHSSLDYHTIKVPPMVEYKSIENYCEKKGEQFKTGFDNPFSGLGSISSAVVLRTPQPPKYDAPLPSSDCQPFCFFSVEELSLVTALTNWTNRKVCAVGMLDYTFDTKECYLRSLGETGSWNVLLDVSNLKTNPAPLKMLQVYGILNIQEDKPKINVCFVRNLGTTDLHLLVQSYKLMEKYVPKCIKRPEKCFLKRERSEEDVAKKESKEDLWNDGSLKGTFEGNFVDEY